MYYCSPPVKLTRLFDLDYITYRLTEAQTLADRQTN
jgi:hypothetical protein